MLKDASRRRFDIVMAWSIDRVGRSLSDLLTTIQHLEAVGVDLYLDQQNIDTTTPTGRLLYQITGAFAEFERSMIRSRVNAGLVRARAKGSALGVVRRVPMSWSASGRTSRPAQVSSRRRRARYRHRDGPQGEKRDGGCASVTR